MDKEVYKRKGLTQDPTYQSGLELGKQAQDPLSTLLPTNDLPIAGRKEFLAGYAIGLERYLLDKGIILPIGTTDLKINIDYPSLLFGIVTGLKRMPPNTPMTPEFNGSGRGPIRKIHNRRA